jgi:hypothetical protein
VRIVRVDDGEQACRRSSNSVLAHEKASVSVEEFLQASSWSSVLVGPVLSEPDDVGAGGSEDVLDVGFCEAAVSAVA